MKFHWIDGFKIEVKIEDDAVVISGNEEGLRSLANHLNTLADEKDSDHFHLDEYNSLEEESKQLIIEKID